MAGTDKTSTAQLFGKISAYSTIVQQHLGKLLNLFSPYSKEYESSLDLVIDILRVLKIDERRLISEILQIVTGDANVASLIESGYHGSLNSLESKIALIETKQESDSFITKLEGAVKTTISSILTSFLSCSVSPFIPLEAFDTYYKAYGVPGAKPLNIPTHILDFSNTLHVSPVSETGIYFYNTDTKIKYYKRDEGLVEETRMVAGIREKGAQKVTTYTYSLYEEELTDEEKKGLEKVVSVPSSVEVKEGQKAPAEFIYTIRPNYTAEGLYKTDDMNAFIWYVANRGDNTQEGESTYEYNKMAWDTRRMNARVQETRRYTAEDWDFWLKSRVEYADDLYLEKESQRVEDLYPILQMEPSESFGNIEHLVITFPAQTYLKNYNYKGQFYEVPRTIYKFNSDYLRSIKIFNWKTIIMNLLYELNGICPIPDIQFNLSLSDEIIDAKLSTLILNTIMADDKEVDDSFYSFTNEDYSEALKRMELRKYRAKRYETASSTAIQNPENIPLDTMNETAAATTLNEITSTITRGVYAVAGTSGSTGITKTTLSYSLAFESNFVYQLLYAIMRPFVRSLLSPQIMLLFCINLDVMGLVNLKDLGKKDMDEVSDFIFRKLSGIIKKLIIQIKDAIVLHLLEIVKKEIKKLIDEVATIILLEQLDDYIRLLTQIMECIRRFGIGVTVGGIDEVTYADIIPEAKTPESDNL